MRKILKTAGLACGLMLAAGPALAEGAQPGHFGFVLGGALEFGGDDVAEVLFTNGDSQDVKAGQGVSVDVGAHYRFADSPVSIRGTIGYKYVTTQAENADINMSRVPLQLIGSYHLENGARVGAGVVRHNSVRFDADGLGPDIDFDDATGFTVEAGWKWFLLSYTGMDYEDDAGNEYSADNFGVKLIWEF
jgi:hypothetical protein